MKSVSNLFSSVRQMLNPSNTSSDEEFFEIEDTFSTSMEDINAQDAKGNTALHRASQEGNKEEMKRLLQNGARYDILNKNNNTALEVVKLEDSINGKSVDNLDYLGILLEQGKFTITQMKKSYHASLIKSIVFADVNISYREKLLKALLNKGVNINNTMSNKGDIFQNHSACTVLNLIFQYDEDNFPNKYFFDIETARLLLEHGADVNALNYTLNRYHTKFTPINYFFHSIYRNSFPEGYPKNKDKYEKMFTVLINNKDINLHVKENYSASLLINAQEHIGKSAAQALLDKIIEKNVIGTSGRRVLDETLDGVISRHNIEDIKIIPHDIEIIDLLLEKGAMPYKSEELDDLKRDLEVLRKIDNEEERSVKWEELQKYTAKHHEERKNFDKSLDKLIEEAKDLGLTKQSNLLEQVRDIGNKTTDMTYTKMDSSSSWKDRVGGNNKENNNSKQHER